MRSPHVAGAIVHKQVVNAFPVRDLDSLVVDSNLFVWFKIVPDKHLLRSTNECRPNFYRGEPVDVDMGNDLFGEIERHVGHIFVTVQMTLPGGDDCLGTNFDEVVHDGKIMRREVPENVDIVLEKAEIDAGGIVVIEISKSSFVEQLGDFLYSGSEKEGMVYHDLEIFLQSKVDQFLPLRGITGKRLLNEYVLTILQCSLCQPVVSPNRRDDGNGVNLTRQNHLSGVRSYSDSRISHLCALECDWADVGNRGQMSIFKAHKVSRDVRPPVA